MQYNRYEAPNLLGPIPVYEWLHDPHGANDGTGDALASMLLALPASASRSVGPSRIDGRSLTGVAVYSGRLSCRAQCHGEHRPAL